MKKIQNLSLSVTIALLVTACGGGSGSEKKDSPLNPSPTGNISHNGTTYDTVTSPLTGKIWLDRNLGAARVCQSINDTACYGDYYQWGRNFDGHQDSKSSTTRSLSERMNNVGSSFILASNSENKYDWVHTVDSDGSQRSANWSKKDGTSVCPLGFRVPTLVELKAELIDMASDNKQAKSAAYNSFLKVPFSGLHAYVSGQIGREGRYSYLWTSSVENKRSFGIQIFNDGESQFGYEYPTFRAEGFSVRCIKD